MWIEIEYWWYKALTLENNWFLNILVKSNFAPPTLFRSVSCVIVGVCLSNYNLYLFLIHQTSYSKGYLWYLMQREVLGSIWKIGRYSIKVSEVLFVVIQSNVCYKSKCIRFIFGRYFYPHAFLKKRRGYCNRLRPSVRPSVRPSRYLLLNHWTKSNQIWCVSCSHE